MTTSRAAPKRSKFLFIFGLVWFVLALPFFLTGIYSYKLEQKYEASGLVAHGLVLNKNMEERYDSKEKRTERTYYVTYRFKTTSGQELESKSSVGSGIWDSLTENTPVDIQYLPEDAATSRIAQAPDYVFCYVFIGLGATMMLLGMLVLSYDIKKRILAKRLLRDGGTAEATVSDIQPGNLTINNVTQWRIHFSFKDTKGKSFEGTTEHLSPAAAREWKVGDKGKVKFDKSKPENHIWIGA